jgi:hypothetical protein
MEYSIWRDEGYSKDEIFNIINELDDVIIESNFKKDDVFFSVLY